MSVSVVIPSYNDAPRLAQALASVRAQSFDDWEAIVVDDGSNPQTQSAIRALASELDDPRIRFVLSRRNRGPARNRNIGIRLARHRFVAFLDCDDLWQPEKLSQQLKAMVGSGAALSCTAYRNLDEESGAQSLRCPPAEIRYEDLLGHNSIGCSTVIMDRDLLGRSYFPDIRMRQDFAHWLRILRAGQRAIGLPEALTTRRIYAGSLSAGKPRAAWYTWRMYRDVMGFGPLTAARYFWRYFRRALRGG